MQQLLLFLSTATLLKYSAGASNDFAASDLSLFAGKQHICWPMSSKQKHLEVYAMDHKWKYVNSCNSICKFHREGSRASVTAWDNDFDQCCPTVGAAR